MGACEIPEPARLALEELKRGFKELYGERLEGIYLYGSYVRGDFTKESDVDVFLVLKGKVKPGAEIIRFSQLLSEICLKYDVLLPKSSIFLHAQCPPGRSEGMKPEFQVAIQKAKRYLKSAKLLKDTEDYDSATSSFLTAPRLKCRFKRCAPPGNSGDCPK